MSIGSTLAEKSDDTKQHQTWPEYLGLFWVFVTICDNCPYLFSGVGNAW